jgi:hypothetical protein
MVLVGAYLVIQELVSQAQIMGLVVEPERIELLEVMGHLDNLA